MNWICLLQCSHRVVFTCDYDPSPRLGQRVHLPCPTCGHTFVVTHAKLALAPIAPAPPAEPEAAVVHGIKEPK